MPAARVVREGRLRLSKAPTAELAAAALDAQAAAGLPDGADFIIVAVPSTTGRLVRQAVEDAARQAVDDVAAAPSA